MLRKQSKKPSLYLHVGQATHFLRWELSEISKYFTLVDKPSEDIPLLCFGPDVLQESSELPARYRYAVLFPGFGHNPVYNDDIKKMHRRIISSKFKSVFINPGPLEIAYKGLDNIKFYPFSIDTSLVKYKGPRKNIKKLIHVSSDYPQKDWRRSEEIMKRTGLKSEVYPQRRPDRVGLIGLILGSKSGVESTHSGKYVDHSDVITKYNEADAFVHVARDIKDPLYIDGKYTASLIEAGLTGCILFWHDTFNLGNNLKTVFSLPLDPTEAAAEIKRVIRTIDVKAHSEMTHSEMLANFNPENSVRIRAEVILEDLRAAD